MMTESEKQDYLLEKAERFSPNDKGKFVISQEPRENKEVIPILYLADRRKTKDFWWTPDASLAMVFFDKQAALKVMGKYKFNNNLKLLKI